MNPITLVGVILGGMSGVFINTLFHSGLVSAASPGSIIAILGMCAKDSYLGILLSILVAAAVSFAVNAILLKVYAKEGNLKEAQAKVNASKQASKGLAPAASSFVPADLKIVFACDAGMGSSAMGAANLTKKLKAAGIDITVPHSALNEVPLDTQIIVTQNSLVERAKARCPQAKIYPIQNFMASSEYDQIVHDLCGA